MKACTMLSKYHIQITTEALQARVSAQALQIIIKANLSQDNLFGQIGHPEYHFDNSAFQAGWDFVESQRQIIMRTVSKRLAPKAAWKAFGRLSHSIQDFYAHSNYVRLWSEQFTEGALPPPDHVRPMEWEILKNPTLHSGRFYAPLELLTMFPGLTPIVRRWLPPDSHAWMNLDSPKSGELFPYALVAARKHTVREFDQLTDNLRRKAGASAVRFFADFRK
jgi:hypothetical protein